MMKTDYKNWMPRGMVIGTAGIAGGFLVLYVVFGVLPVLQQGKVRTVVGMILLVLTSIAMYEILQRYGKSEEEAYKIVSEEMWKFLNPSRMQKLVKKSFFDAV